MSHSGWAPLEVGGDLARWWRPVLAGQINTAIGGPPADLLTQRHGPELNHRARPTLLRLT